jgi:predicted DNA repair protein MutK
MQQVVVLSGIAIVMTVGVYGLVAGIVKLDDLGLWLTQKTGQMARSIGGGILRTAPYMMKSLSVIGTAAMFMVGGGILTHGVPVVHHWVETVSQSVGGVAWLMPTLLNAGVGIVAGAAVLVVVSVVGRLWRTARA